MKKYVLTPDEYAGMSLETERMYSAIEFLNFETRQMYISFYLLIP